METGVLPALPWRASLASKRQHRGPCEVVTHREHQVVERRPTHAAHHLLDLPLVVHLVRLVYRVTCSVVHLHTLSWPLYAQFNATEGAGLKAQSLPQQRAR